MMKRALIKGVINGTRQYNTNWIGISITDIQVSREAKVTRSPVELGYEVMDAKVVQPAEITIKANRFFLTTRLCIYSTVTDLARFLGWSTFLPLQTAM